MIHCMGMFCLFGPSLIPILFGYIRVFPRMATRVVPKKRSKQILWFWYMHLIISKLTSYYWSGAAPPQHPSGRTLCIQMLYIYLHAGGDGCSEEQLSFLELLRKQLESLDKIHSVDRKYINTVIKGAITDYIRSFSATSSPDFKHLKVHLESLCGEKNFGGDPALLMWALKEVEKKASEKAEDSPDTNLKALFCEDTIYHASLCCLAVNKCSSDSCQTFFSDQNEIQGHSLSEVSLSLGDAERCLIAKQGESIYYIAFQGRTDIHEWLDLNASFEEGWSIQGVYVVCIKKHCTVIITYADGAHSRSKLQILLICRYYL